MLVTCWIGSVELKFTWRGPIFHVGQIIYEKFDRALCNEAWRMKFLEAYVKVLTRVDFSDYHLILITPENSKHNEAPKQFRFQSAWMLEECYQDMITKSWTDDYGMDYGGKYYAG